MADGPGEAQGPEIPGERVEHDGRSAEERRGVSFSGAFGENSLRREAPVPLSDDQVQVQPGESSCRVGDLVEEGRLGEAPDRVPQVDDALVIFGQ